jgi:hypothetical protein
MKEGRKGQSNERRKEGRVIEAFGHHSFEYTLFLSPVFCGACQGAEFHVTLVFVVLLACQEINHL